MSPIAFKPIYFENNQGHGNARRASLDGCSNELVALMDADDLCVPHRFELQLGRFIKNPMLSAVGGQILEFSDSPDNIIGIRKVPLNNTDIVRYSKKRCPMNQVSVMLRKSDVEAVGGYVDWYCEEDYYLWLRMIKGKYCLENLSEILVNVRAGEKMTSRRGGLRYFMSEAKLQNYMLGNGIISLPIWIYNVFIRFAGEVLLTNSLRNKAYALLRSRKPEMETSSEKRYITDCISTGFPKFSVAMCVYGNDNPEWFDEALNSVINQTIKPSEIVLVVDGPVPDSIHAVIEKYGKICEGGTI